MIQTDVFRQCNQEVSICGLASPLIVSALTPAVLELTASRHAPSWNVMHETDIVTACVHT